MFRLIDSLHDQPIRLVCCSTEILEPGTIVKLVDGVYCDRCDGQKPFGIVADYPDEYGMVPVWYDTIFFETNIFDIQNVTLNTPLYVNSNGVLTDLKNEDSYLVARIWNIKDPNQKVLEINWI